MSVSTSQSETNASLTLPLLTTVISILVLFALLAVTSKMEEFASLSFLVPYENYISIALVALLGHVAVQSGTKWVYVIVQRRMSADVARTVRVISRLIGYGLIFSFLVSVLTDNAAAALTLGSFAGLVAGFASQTVMGHTVAGIFLALFRPIGIGDNVTIGRNSGIVTDITLMHIVLDSENEQSMIPSSTVVSTVLIKHKSSD